MLYYLLLTDLICFFGSMFVLFNNGTIIFICNTNNLFSGNTTSFSSTCFGNNYFSVFNTSYRFYNDKLIFRDIELVWIKVIYLSGLLKANTYYIIQNGHPSCNRNTNCSNTSCAFTLALILFLPLIY